MSRRAACVAIALAFAGCDGPAREASSSSEEAMVEVTVAAAWSVRHVMPDLVVEFQRQHPRLKVAPAYGASGDLEKRVVDGAPFDAVMFASAQPVDRLVGAGLVERTSRRVVATNTLVLIGPRSRETPSTLTFATLDALPSGDKLAIGDPGAVPAGQYAKDALTKLGKWDALQDRIVLGGDVAAVRAYAQRGEVAAAIVYATEVRGIDDVTVLDRASGDWAPRAEVVVGVVKSGEHAKQAGRFLELLASPEGQAIFEKHGFGKP